MCHAHCRVLSAGDSLATTPASVYRVGTWLRGMPQRIQFIKLNMAVALRFCAILGQGVSCCHAAGCCTYLLILFLFCFCRCLRSGLCYQQSSFRIPFSRIPYAICRVPFPDLCNSMHVPHFCCKTCRTCRMWLCHTAATKIPQKVPQTRHVKHVWHELYGKLH